MKNGLARRWFSRELCHNRKLLFSPDKGHREQTFRTFFAPRPLPYGKTEAATWLQLDRVNHNLRAGNWSPTPSLTYQTPTPVSDFDEADRPTIGEVIDAKASTPVGFVDPIFSRYELSESK